MRLALNWKTVTHICIILGASRAWIVSSLASVGGSETSRESYFSFTSRRSLLREVVAIGSTACIPVVSNAEDAPPPPPQTRDGKPYAPLPALLPATRVRVWIEPAYALSSTLVSTSGGRSGQYETLVQMNSILANPPKFFVSEKLPKRTIRPTAQITTGVSSVNKEQYQRNRAELTMPDRIAAMLNQADVERQWGMLQYAESKREEGNEIRAAFNYYTSQLQFADSFTLTASKEEKKRMIRNDEVPSLSAVITSDLDLRDLYRNQFLTAIEDAKAEVSYQLRQPVDSVDVSDVVDLMNQAHTACSNWFGLIPIGDAQEALDVVMRETA